MEPNSHTALSAQRVRGLAEATAVGEVMSRAVVCLTPDMHLTQVSALFLERGISSAPVVDDNWHPVGMISKTDLLRMMSEEGPDVANPAAGSPQLKVSDVTTPQVLSLHEEAPIAAAAALMAFEGVHRLPIVASSGEVTGVVSTLDIVRWLARCGQADASARSV